MRNRSVTVMVDNNGYAKDPAQQYLLNQSPNYYPPRPKNNRDDAYFEVKDANGNYKNGYAMMFDKYGAW